MNVITTTLGTENVLTITPTFDSGELLIAKLLLCVLAVIVLDFIFILVYRR